MPHGIFQETESAVEAIKRELPNTRKRLSRATYRNYLKSKQRANEQKPLSPEEQHAQLVDETDPFYV